QPLLGAGVPRPRQLVLVEDPETHEGRTLRSPPLAANRCVAGRLLVVGRGPAGGAPGARAPGRGAPARRAPGARAPARRAPAAGGPALVRRLDRAGGRVDQVVRGQTLVGRRLGGTVVVEQDLVERDLLAGDRAGRVGQGTRA